MHTVTISTKGWIVIPKDLRDKYGLRKGTRVQIVDYDQALALVPLPDDPAKALHGMLEGGPSLTVDLLAEHTHERAQEENRHG
ncbi:MAG: AbrB/MazE/SpoVT family DNA-binding domain-containing protein [Anaerolineales bacterium]|nr:AbrB/MazE/SpoVT family DNA-binding domain-containing protein [Anaerolineales bacterium]